MASNFEDFERERVSESSSSEEECLDLEYFELVSAYLDGELSSAEKTQVQFLLDNDSKIKRIYTQLSMMQSQINNLAAPPASISSQQLSANVFQTIDRTRNRRKALLLGGAIATTCLAAISGLLPVFNSFSLRTAKGPVPSSFSQPVMVAVALDKPAVKIPKAAGEIEPQTTRK